MASTPVSPKVTAGASTGAIVGLLLSYASSVQPDMFAFLGKWQGFAFLLFTLAVSAGTAWVKSDPLRAVAAPVNTPDVPEAPATPAVSFGPTQAKLDALPVDPTTEVTPVYTAP